MAVTKDTLEGVYAFSSQADALVGKQRVVAFGWVGKGLTAGDDLLVVDAASNVLWEAVAVDTAINLQYMIHRPVEGIRAKTLDGGNLYIVLASNEKDFQY